MNFFPSVLSQASMNTSNNAVQNYSNSSKQTSFVSQIGCYVANFPSSKIIENSLSPVVIRPESFEKNNASPTSSTSSSIFQSPSVTTSSAPLKNEDEEYAFDGITDLKSSKSSKLLLSQFQLLNHQNKVANNENCSLISGYNNENEEKEERPSLSYKDLIIEAIESSSEKRLKLSEIYQVSFFDYFLNDIFTLIF